MQPLTARRPQNRSHRDPAPSRWSYRVHRIMLTPHLRVLMRVGLPTLLLVGGLAVYFANPEHRSAIVSAVTKLRDQFEDRPEFRVTLASIEGASPELADAVRDKLGLSLPRSSFDIDLDAARLRIEELDAIKKADLRVRSGGVLQVQITERDPVAVWRLDEGLTLIDESGHRVAGLLARSDRSDLPLVAGVGADAAMPEALDILAAASPLAPRIRGLIRMGERRWDVVLDRDQRVLLPTENPVRAIERLLALDQVQDIMNRDVLTIDLRNDHRPVLRLTPYALSELRKTQGIVTVENEL